MSLLFWKALLGLLAFDISGLACNFSRLHRTVAGWPVAQKTAHPEVLERTCSAMNYACSWYPKQARCLQRAAVTTCLLRTCGVPAQMVLGAQKLPFKAHAWVEVDGRVINERRPVQAIYRVCERC
jgi:hypothetical protein